MSVIFTKRLAVENIERFIVDLLRYRQESYRFGRSQAVSWDEEANADGKGFRWEAIVVNFAS